MCRINRRVSVSVMVGVGNGVCLWCRCWRGWIVNVGVALCRGVSVGLCLCGDVDVPEGASVGCQGLSSAGRGLARCVVSEMRCGVVNVVVWSAAGRACGPVQPGEERAWRRLSQGECRVGC
jgi:hypothetical protein